MRINIIGSNQTELYLGNGTVVLFSYNTPVAARTPNGFIKTSTKWSNTTSKHINKWGGYGGKEVEQSVLDSLVK
jgi:hypothetical protein